MIIEEIAKYIHAQGIAIYDPDGTTGIIFLEQLPATPDTVIALYSRGGQGAHSVSNFKQPGAQIIVRGMDILATNALAQSVWDALNNKYNINFSDGGSHVVRCVCAQSEPIHIGTDSNNRHEYSINLNMITED